MPGDPRIRASDADRDRVASLLREHHAAGRLTAEEFHERMDRALEARTLGELDELMADLPAIDLYQLPDASLRRAPPHLGQSLLPADLGGHGPARFAPGTVAMGVWAAVTSALVAIWAVAAVVGGGTWFPWWALIALPWIWAISPPLAASRGIAARPAVSYNLGGSRRGAGSSTLVSGPSAGSCLAGARGFAYATTIPT